MLVAVLCSSAAAQQPNVWPFDMGGADSPVWPGFTQVTAENAYSADLGYGWLLESEDIRAYLAGNIDALAIDDISGLGKRTGQFRVDLPDGEYTVWVLTGAMGNIWRLRSMRQAHELLTGDEVVATVDPPEERLFEVANYEWSAGDDLWRRYVGSRFQWLRVETTVTDGALVPGFRPHIAFPVNAVMIAARDIAGRAQEKASFAVFGLRDLEEVIFSPGEMTGPAGGTTTALSMALTGNNDCPTVNDRKPFVGQAFLPVRGATVAPRPTIPYDWTELSGATTVPPGAAWGMVWFSPHNEGTAYCDDLRVTRVPGGDLPKLPVTAGTVQNRAAFTAAQDQRPEGKVLACAATDDPPTIDGALDEACWASAGQTLGEAGFDFLRTSRPFSAAR